MYLSYPVTLTEDGYGTVYALCPDVPEAMSHADNREEAAAKARGALEGALELYRQQGRPIPRPGKTRGDFVVVIQADATQVAPAPRGRFGKAASLSRWLEPYLEH